MIFENLKYLHCKKYRWKKQALYYNAHLIKPYRSLVHLWTGFRQGFIKCTLKLGKQEDKIKNSNSSPHIMFLCWKIFFPIHPPWTLSRGEHRVGGGGRRERRFLMNFIHCIFKCFILRGVYLWKFSRMNKYANISVCVYGIC